MADMLTVEGADGHVLLAERAPEGGEWCLRWNHSVTGGEVADCFVNDGGQMVLRRSYLHDFAAGLGTVEGRGGRLVPAPRGGYWIEGLREEIPGNALTLRVGSERVDHRLVTGGAAHRLSPRAAGARVTIRLVPED